MFQADSVVFLRDVEGRTMSMFAKTRVRNSSRKLGLVSLPKNNELSGPVLSEIRRLEGRARRDQAPTSCRCCALVGQLDVFHESRPPETTSTMRLNVPSGESSFAGILAENLSTASNCLLAQFGRGGVAAFQAFPLEKILEQSRRGLDHVVRHTYSQSSPPTRPSPRFGHEPDPDHPQSPAQDSVAEASSATSPLDSVTASAGLGALSIRNLSYELLRHGSIPDIKCQSYDVFLLGD